MGTSRESKKRQRERRKEREKGLSKQEKINLRKANAMANNYTQIEEAGNALLDTVKATRGTSRTYIHRLRLIQLSGAQNHRCCYCGQKTWHSHIIDGGDVKHTRRTQATIEHVVALVHGGTWCKDNLVMACDECNGARGEKSVERFVALITENINIPISKTLKRILRKEEKAKTEKGQIKTAKTFRLLFIAATYMPELLASVVDDYDPKKRKKTRSRRCYISAIRKRVIANRLVFR